MYIWSVGSSARILKNSRMDPAAAPAIARRIARSLSDFTYDPTGRLLDAARAEVLTLLDH